MTSLLSKLGQQCVQQFIKFQDLQGHAVVRDSPIIGQYAGVFVAEDVPQIGALGKPASA